MDFIKKYWLPVAATVALIWLAKKTVQGSNALAKIGL